jgi:phosphocarrier protein HPr
VSDEKNIVFTKTLTIVNKRGLHARAAAKFVKTMESFSCSVNVTRDTETVSGRSIMGLMMLAASKGAIIQVKATGIDGEQAIQRIMELVDNKFNEE